MRWKPLGKRSTPLKHILANRGDDHEHQIERQTTPVEIMMGEKPTEERFWYEHHPFLGIVLFDKIDKDWSYVALHREDGVFRCFDLGVSFNSPKEAEFALEKSLTAIWIRNPR